MNIGSCRHVKVLQPGRSSGEAFTSANVGKIEVYDGARSGRPVVIREVTGSGLNLDDWGPGPLRLAITLEHYGDVSSQASLELTWT